MTHKLNYRVIYGDTDAMGIVYYANYLRFYEMGRSEYMRDLGLPYGEIAAKGIECPAVSVNLQYKKPASFDNLITIETKLKEMPRAIMCFEQRILLDDILLNEAIVNLCFLDMKKQKPVRCPEFLREFLTENVFQ
ncbi:MAG: YbgC/FadM family acyl-CoA thioesterase [Bacteroidales bacterium]|nr:YbgC/FadM family acyl-CoA thioesterase [Bacteroidales bacterium]